MKERDTYNEPLGENKLPDSLRVTPFSTPENFFSSQEESIRAQLKIEKYNLTSESPNYPIPEGYFDQLEDQILMKILENTLKKQVPQLEYQVPDGYFETLENSIRARVSESKLQETISGTGFIIPTDYFAAQEDSILAAIIEGNLKSKVKDTGFITPEDYFENLTDSIHSTMLTDQWKHKIPKEGFSVPDDYFVSLSHKIKNATLQINSDQKDAKIVSIPKRKNWINYASTAAVVFLVGIGSYFAIQEETTAPAVSTAQSNRSNIDLHTVSDEEILEYLAQVSEGEDLIHLTKFVEQETTDQVHIDKKIDDEDIKEYLNYML